ncbi:MAG: 2-oxoacid:acceptor oxidoreductase subunit alpha [Polyangiaceae bacterium]|jgi:2-oxoglutarate/2-oxoacid ferredoxin oxidoreductase subunit alpha
MDDLVIGMAGSGGDGIVSAGESLIAAAAYEGYSAMMTKSFGSQVRGGESSCRVRLSTHRVNNPGGLLDVAVALNWEDFLKFGAELPVSGATVIIYESKTGVAPGAIPLVGVSPKEVFAVPIGDIAKQATGTDKAKNTVVLGLIAGWFGIARLSILRGLEKRFAKKGAALVQANEKAFVLGELFAKEHPLATPRAMDRPIGTVGKKMLVDGNDMCAAAAIFGGCDFFAGYPITPSTEVMQFFTREVWKYGGAALQAEDEIAGIGAALGASFAGKKAMTATSGPGMALKTEMMGLASIAEIPLVILDVQRGGPSTGLPTKPEQSDLFMAAFSAPGDVLRPILAPTSVSDTFDVTVEAFNIAERYQTPVIILSDQEIAQRKETVDPIDTSRFTIEERRRPTEADLQDYARFRLTEDGVSPISHPGMKGGNYQGAGIEHNEHANPTASGKVHAAMNEKRFRKLAPLKGRRDLFHIDGNPNAKLALVGWGSVAGVCREAFARAQGEGLDVKLLVPWLVYPVAEDVYRDFFASVRAGFVVELSHQGQLYRILRMFTDVPARVVSLARSGANPFQPAELLSQLRNAAVSLQQPNVSVSSEE